MQNKTLNAEITGMVFLLSRLMKEGITFTGDVGNLTLLQLQALVYIKQEKGVTMSGLASQFAISLPTATVLSDKLIKEGFVSRVRNTTDRRVVRLAITKKGSGLLQKALKQRNTKIEHMLSYLTDTKKEQLLDILTSLVEGIQTHHEKK